MKLGMLISKGEYLLFADADNATKVNGFDELHSEIHKISTKGLGVVVGSRNHLRKDVVKEVILMKRSKIRKFLNSGLIFGIKVLCWTKLNVKIRQDTQCGFKLFTRTSAQKLFLVQHLERWAFDVELVFVCQK